MTYWWQTGVIYQIYPRSFMDGNGDGIGDLPGIITRLDYLQWLGVDAIWISPIFTSPMADFGYDVANYEDIDPLFGTLADFDALLDAAHQRGLKVILDFVPNHTSDQHPWFKEARASRDNPKRDWYIWRDPQPDGSLPNNWESFFGGPAWTFDESTGQYYLHNFDPAQPELNWRNPQVPQAIYDAMHFWLKRGLDGFRIDVVDRLIKDEALRDNPPDPLSGGLKRVYSEQQPEVHHYIRQMRQVFDAYENRVSVGEIAYDAPIDKVVGYYGAATGDGGDELHLPFNFHLIMLPWNAEAIRAHVDAYDAAVPAHGWPNYVLGNHDVARIASRLGDAHKEIAAMLLLTLRGTPTLYYGDEIGMTDAHIPPEQALDPAGQRGGLGGYNRDQCRTPMQWDDNPLAGFSIDAAARPWLPLAENYPQLNVAAQKQNAQSTLALYRRLLALRRASPALQLGAYQSLESPAGCFVYLRQADEQRYMVALNFTPEEKTLHLEATQGQIVLSTRPDRDGEPLNSAVLILRPYEGVICRL